MTATEHVILVDAYDNEIGQAEKLEAHQKNLLHRAFSIFIFRNDQYDEVLLQQRALHKYHSPGLWSNTCCSHPRPGESVLAAGQRRLHEELGFTTPLRSTGSFIYNVHFDNGLAEHELDHVLIGVIGDNTPTINPDEIHDLRWIKLDALVAELAQHPDHFTPWFQQALKIAKG